MHFQMPDDVLAFRDEVRAFIQREMNPELEAEMRRGPEAEGPAPASARFRNALRDSGLPLVAWPEDCGGQGKGALYLWVLSEELGGAGLPFDLLTYNSVGPAIIRNGTEQQRSEWLPRVLAGDMRFAVGYTEPDAGSDLASLKTRAVRDGDEWVINGQKMYTSGAHTATHVWLAARTDPEAPKHRGISVFVVPLDAPGVEIRPLHGMSGIRTNETFYDNVRVPHANMVGPENGGFSVISGALDLERVAIAAYSAFRRTVDEFVDYVKDDRPDLLQDPVARTGIADFRMRVEVARALATNNAAMVHSGLIPTVEASMAKVWKSDSLERAVDFFMDLLGEPGGLQPSSPGAPLHGALENEWRASPQHRFAGGTNDVARRIIANRGLGLPRS